MNPIIHVDQRKWPDREHYQLHVRRLGSDEHGTWLHARPGTVVTRGQDDPWPLPGGFVGLVPREEWWLVEFYPSHPTISVYVNIGTPPKWDGARVTQIDLDLDVIQRLDGGVEIIDVDEFEENRALFGYPDELATAAIEAADQAVELLGRGVEPFAHVAENWLDRASETR